MIFKALQFELVRFKFHSPSSKILKIPEFNLDIRYLTVEKVAQKDEIAFVKFENFTFLE